MSNKNEAHEPGTKPAVWARSEPGMAQFYAGQAGQAQINGPGSDKKLGTVS